MGQSEYSETFVEYYNQWQWSLPGSMRPRPIDFMGIEQYRPYSLGVSFYSSDQNFYISPGNDRAIIEAFACIPPDFRAVLHANDMLLEMAANGLADVPYVREGDNEIRRKRAAPEAFFKPQ